MKKIAVAIAISLAALTSAFGQSRTIKPIDAGLSQLGLIPSSIGAPGGTMLSYANGDAIVLQCTGVTFTVSPVVSVVNSSAGAVTGSTITIPGLVAGSAAVPNATVNCSQASTSGTGTGYTTTASLGPNIYPAFLTNGGTANNGNLFLNWNPLDGSALTFGGGENTYLGEKAGFGLQGNAQQSTAVGMNACGLGGTGVTAGNGSNMVCLGTDAGRNIQGSSISNDVLIGQGAGRNLGTNSQNEVIIGASAAGSNGANSAGAFSGAADVIIGYNAGKSLATGGFNRVLIGANILPTTLTAGSNLIVIGTSNACDTPGSNTNSAIVVCAGGGQVWGATGTSTPSTSASTIAGTLTVAGIAATAQADVVCTTSAGLLTYQVSATGCAASSERFKQDLKPISNEQGLMVVASLEPKQYHYRPETNMGSDVHFGFTAEQVEKVDPSLITYEEDGRPHAVKYNELWPFLTAAIKQLKAENDKMRACNDNWKCRLFGVGK